MPPQSEDSPLGAFLAAGEAPQTPRGGFQEVQFRQRKITKELVA
jgi:hypothetical protein